MRLSFASDRRQIGLHHRNDYIRVSVTANQDGLILQRVTVRLRAGSRGHRNAAAAPDDNDALNRYRMKFKRRIAENWRNRASDRCSMETGENKETIDDGKKQREKEREREKARGNQPRAISD